MALSVWFAVKHSLSILSNGAVPHLRWPATFAERLRRIAPDFPTTSLLAMVGLAMLVKRENLRCPFLVFV